LDTGQGQAEYLQTELLGDGGVLAVTLARGDNPKNQLNVPFVAALEEVFTRARELPRLKGLILRSAHEKVFSTGADIAGEMTALDPAQARAFSQRGRDVFGILTQLPCPTVACIAGFCLGGGLELALCCDFRIAAKNARLGLPEINLGLIPGWGGTQRLPRLIGQPRALRMILSGDPLNAEAALESGLVDEVADDHSALLPAAQRLLARFGDKAAQTLCLAKRAVYGGLEKGLEGGLTLESDLFGQAWGTAERVEGISAFMEKRRPQWPDKGQG
jgi:enoyl-CoA hydratase/carnithine racemase